MAELNSRPLVVLTCFLIAGILLAAFLPLSPRAVFFACGLLFFAALAGSLRGWRNTPWLICLLFLAAGFTLARLADCQVNPALFKYTGHWVTVEGVVVREADVRPEVVYYHIKMKQIAAGEEKSAMDARVLVRVAVSGRVYSYGDLLRVHGLLVRPDEPGNPGEFDYRAYLARRGIGAILKVEDPSQITRLGIDGNPLLRRILLFKEKMLAVSRQTLPPAKAALVNGIVFGTQGEIPQGLRDLFNKVGIVHILSVSGLHVGLVLGGILFLLRIFRAPQRWLAPLGSVVLILYALLCGMGPAVTRAALMGLMFLWAHHLGRDQDWPTTLSVAALISLLLNPLALYDIGFQLSFAATWGILYLGPVINKWTRRLLSRPDWVIAVIWVSLAAQLATLPLVARYYNLVSPVSLLANIAAAPLTGLILALGAAAGLAGVVWLPLAGLINASTSFALDLFTGLVSLLPAFPGAVFYVATPPLPAILAWYPLLCLVVMVSNGRGWPAVKNYVQESIRQRHRAMLAAASGVILILAVWVVGHPEKKELTLHLIDVGQGDSILIQTPAGKNILIDAGGWSGEFESGRGAGDRVVVPYLRRLGVKRLDVLVITHPHEDHAGGAMAVAKAFPVELAAISPVGFRAPLTVENDPLILNYLDPDYELPPAYRQLLIYLVNKKTPVRPVRAGDEIKCDPRLVIRVLAPPFPLLKGTRSDENNASVVLQVRYGGQTFLLTGDIEVEAQEWLVNSGANLQADVLKVPHHGSRFSSPAFFENVRPALALISVGKHNRFNMPASETLERLKMQGAAVYRTDEHGAVILSADGNNLRVKTGRAFTCRFKQKNLD